MAEMKPQIREYLHHHRKLRSALLKLSHVTLCHALKDPLYIPYGIHVLLLKEEKKKLSHYIKTIMCKLTVQLYCYIQI